MLPSLFCMKKERQFLSLFCKTETFCLDAGYYRQEHTNMCFTCTYYATISAVSDQNNAGIFCSGSVVNRGAKIDGEIDAIGGVHN